MNEIDPVELPALAAAWAAAGLPRPLLLDVREPWEVACAAIDHPAFDGLRIPMGQIVERQGEIDRMQPVVCLCHHGVRSAQVVAFLSRQGHDPVYNLAGGIEAWSTQVDASVPRY